MYYLEVMVADATYHGHAALTYSSDRSLSSGSLVLVPLRDKAVLGFVTKHATKRPAFDVKRISYAYDLPPLPPQLVALHEWVYTYYPTALGVITRLFLPQKLPKETQISETPTHYTIDSTELPTLTADQSNALQNIESPGLHILHGETGAGKTRVYLELAKKTVSKGKNVLILTPEIGLTTQLVDNFTSTFGNKIALVHSQLTELKRGKTWLQILKRNINIVIGTRSALFAPLPNIGLVIIDESHEPTYKQDQAPYYHANLVAAQLANLHKAILVLGSATPSVTDYAIAEIKNKPIIRMQETAIPTQTLLKPRVVDLRNRSNHSKSPHISKQLLASIETTLKKNEQVLLYLNRRGTARTVLCENCGWQAVCPHCNLPLVFHEDSYKVRCHSCSYIKNNINACPSCSNPTIIFKNAGTKAIASEVQKLFPEAKIQRFDTDNSKHERLEHHIESVQNGSVDIIVGTQTIGKGLDLPKLSLVGIILAETSLSFPDFSAQERTYQLLRQVIGRVGRGHRPGHVIVQTYQPQNPTLQAAISGGWAAYYAREMEERQRYKFPPYFYLLKLHCRRASNSAAEKASIKLVTRLEKEGLPVTIEGPAPAFKEKVQNAYQWQIIIKSRQRKHLIDIIKHLPSNWSYDIDPINLL